MIGLPSFQSVVTFVPINHFLISSGEVKAFQTFIGLAWISTEVSTVKVLLIEYFVLMNMFSCHTLAFFGTVAAGFGTYSAMFHMNMFLAFFGTSLAELCAYPTYVSGMNTSQGHDSGSTIAHLRAFPFQLNTFGKQL